MNGVGLGVSLMLGQQVFFTAETIIVHQIGGSLGLMQIALLRCIGGLLLVVVLTRGCLRSALTTGQLRLQLARGLTSAGYLGVFAYSFTALPLTDATALGYATALYMVLFAPLLLGERVGMQRWIAVGTGLAGAMMIVRPGFQTFSTAYLWVLAGTALNGLATVLTALLQRRDSPLTVMLYLNLVGIFCFMPGAAYSASSARLSPWMFGLLVFGPVGQYLGILALRYAEVSTLAPCNYIRLVLASAAAFLIFGEAPDGWSIAGASIIFAGCVLAVPAPRRAIGSVTK
nr:DMT family transporter [uncultured Rhodopila sp.]